MTDNTNDSENLASAYAELLNEVMTDEIAVATVDMLCQLFRKVPRPMINGVAAIGCADEVDLRLEAVYQFLSMLDAIFSDDTADMAIAASIASLARQIDDGTVSNGMPHEDVIAIVEDDTHCATCGNECTTNDVGLCAECQDCDGCRKGTCND